MKRKVLPSDGRLMTCMERIGTLRRAQLREVITSQNVTSFFGTSWHAGTLGIKSELYSQPWIFPSRLPLWLTRGQCAVMVSTVSCIGCFLWKSQGQITRGRQQATCPLHGILNIEKLINYHIRYNVKSFQ